MNYLIILIISLNMFRLNANMIDKIHLKNIDFELDYDCKEKIPIFTNYYLTAFQLKLPNLKRRTYFPQDKRLPKYCRSKTQDYKNQGINRGHIANNDNFNYALKTQKQTFLMSNITPQFPAFNKGIWKKVENIERKIALEYGRIYVENGNFGCLYYLPAGECVPNLFYKKIVYDKNKVIFLIPNRKKYNNKDINNYIIEENKLDLLKSLY